MVKELIKNLKKDMEIIIKDKKYIVKTKTWYKIEEDENSEYVKCELSNNRVLVIIPDDSLIYIGQIIQDMNYEKMSEGKIKYNNIVFNKIGDGHQFIKSIEFGNENEIEGKCTFEDYESENKIISLGILTDKGNIRADVYADILDIKDIIS